MVNFERQGRELISSYRLWASLHPQVIVDANLRILTANRLFCQFFQARLEEIAGRFLDGLINLPAEILRLRETPSCRCSSTGNQGDMEIEMSGPSFGQRTLRIHCHRLHGNGLMVFDIEDVSRWRPD